MSAVIEANELSRWYGSVMGLNNVSFTIGEGITGLIGPNGAGKSTLIQIITGQLQASSGKLRVYGKIPWNNPQLLQCIGYCPEREALPVELKPHDWMQGLAQISGMSAAEAGHRSSAMLERVGLAREHWTKAMGHYSKGMRQRVKLAQALVHEPRLLVLDEPMNGLDPMGRQEMATLLRQLANAGTDIIISSHILAELETLCRNNLILNWGRIIAAGDRDEIRSDVKDWSEQLSVLCDKPNVLARHLFDAGLLNGFDLEVETGALIIRLNNPEKFYKQWTGLLIQSGVTIYEIRGQSRSLENIFDKVTV